MRKLLPLLFLLTGLGAFADDAVVLFPDTKLDLPDLSLAAMAKLTPPIFSPLATEPASRAPILVPDEKLVHTPADGVDYKLLIKPPSPGIDYQLLVIPAGDKPAK